MQSIYIVGSLNPKIEYHLADRRLDEIAAEKDFGVLVDNKLPQSHTEQAIMHHVSGQR